VGYLINKYFTEPVDIYVTLADIAKITERLYTIS
jgi:hypothetical protein